VPEGDTIHDAAARLRAAFGDAPLARFEAPALPSPHPSPGEAMSIAARGKHLLIGFDRLTLHTHLGMDGAWRIQRDPRGAALVRRHGRPGRGPQVRVATETAAAVCADPATIELLDDVDVRRHPVLAALGPDLCDPSPDLDEVARRLGGLDPATPIGEVLLDQRPACGIGNVYRSEVLWAERVAPTTALGDLVDEARGRLYATAHRLLRANLGRWPRRTVDGGLAVYERTGRPCPRCRTSIRSTRLGERARTVWWCPSCQAGLSD
jgi:endonuclease VIII